MRGRVRSCGLLMLVWSAASGCALSHRAATSNPFVKPGKPLVEIDQPVKKPKATRPSPRAPADVRPTMNVRLAPTIETTDSALSAALLKLAFATTAEGHDSVAERYHELGISDMAYDHFLTASRLRPTDASAYEGLARIWREWGFPRLGLADATRAVYFAPSSASAHNTLGTLLSALGQRAEARKAFDRAARLAPAAAYPLNNLCYLSFVGGETSRALAECRGALALDPTLAAARETLASLERRETRDPIR